MMCSVRPQLIKLYIMLVYISLISSVTLCVIIPQETSATPRCWIGVIDQINPPWIMISGEYDEEVIVSLQHAYTDAEEGDWVIYWTESQRIEEIKSPHTHREIQRLKSLSRSLDQRSHDLDLEL